MATRPQALPSPTVTEEEREYIASQWQLIWWRFRRHRLALGASLVLLAFYSAVLFPEFLSTHDPSAESAARTRTPPLSASTSSTAGSLCGPTSTASPP